MIVEIENGDIFSTKCQIVINPTNSVGIMGGGLAKTFITRYPKECAEYNEYTAREYSVINTPKLLSPFITPVQSDKQEFTHICHLATKIVPWKPSKLEYVDFGLIRLRKMVVDQTIAMPALGCGLGGLQYDDVIKLIRKYFEDYPSLVEVYLPL